MPAPIWSPPPSGSSQPDMSAYLAQVTGNSNPNAFSNSVTGQAAQQRNALGQYPVTSYTGDGSPLVDIGGGMKMNISNGQVYGDSGPMLDQSGNPLKYAIPYQKDVTHPGTVNDYLNSLGGPTSNVNDLLNSLTLNNGTSPISSTFKGYGAPPPTGNNSKTTFNYLGKQYEYDPATGKYSPVASTTTTPPPGGGGTPPAPPPAGGGTGTNDFMTMLEGMIPGISKNPGALYQLLIRSLFGMQGGGGGFGGYGTPSYGMAGNPMQAFLKFFSSQVPQGF